jgi:homoserine dehydrogenase
VCVEPTIVLKLGGSVLRDELQMRSAVHEVYRWRREGWRVVAVVSALTGRTDELLAKCARLYKRRSPLSEASVAASGELESAALLGLHLNRAGVPASVLTPGVSGFLADGDPLDSMPQSINADVLERALARFGTVVFPGYVATGSRGGTVVLGRGGSDLTALFLADALGADRCRLIKDVEGLFDRDPSSSSGSAARMFACASYEDALATDGSILQHKAVEFARDRQVEFEVSRPNGASHTSIASQRSAFRPTPSPAAPLRVALLGHGTVGEGVRELLGNLPHFFAVTHVAVRSPGKHPVLTGLGVCVHADPMEVAGSDVDVVVEAMGGTGLAAEATARALERGTPVVTANKSALADHGPRLRALSDLTGACLLRAASVGGAAPILEAVQRRRGVQVASIRAVLNGTANFILNAVARGSSFSGAVSQARELGFAEEDPRRDLRGLDAADKLRVLAQELGLEPVGEEDVPRDVLCKGIQRRPHGDGALRQVATLTREGSRASCAVRIQRLASDDPLAEVNDEENAAVIVWDDGVSTTVRGAGAGRWPTAEAVVADLLTLERERHTALREHGRCPAATRATTS